MRAQSLTISVPSEGCDKNCPYCISKMTGFMDSDEEQFYNNLKKVKTVARSAQVSSVLITAKGEPFLNLKACNAVGKNFSDYPLEIQTNGIKLLDNWKESGSVLCSNYFDVIAFSIDSISQWEKLQDLMLCLSIDYNIVVRVTLNMTDILPKDFSFNDAYDYAFKSGVSQLSFRNIVIPDNPIETINSKETSEWIHNHCCEERYCKIVDNFKEFNDYVNIIRKLPFGVTVYDFKGISVTMFEECLQHNNNNEDIRSLIYQEDGHMYTSWNSSASILF